MRYLQLPDLLADPPEIRLEFAEQLLHVAQDPVAVPDLKRMVWMVWTGGDTGFHMQRAASLYRNLSMESHHFYMMMSPPHLVMQCDHIVALRDVLLK